ncbi:uncharacterized protein TNCV_3075321 [Trichonephila clavipes]|nr:uncharacterized protein TNCV_3075321 [Trichonephila clavipes]
MRNPPVPINEKTFTGTSFCDFTCRNCGGGDRGRVAIYRPFGEVSLSLNRTVTCMVLKANDRRTSCPCHDEFRGPRSDYVRQKTPVDWNCRLNFCSAKIRQQNQRDGQKKAQQMKSDHVEEAES